MILAILLSISFSGLPAQLEAKAKTALADVGKAKSALSAGNSKSSQSWLAKAESLLGSVFSQVPGGDAFKKADQASNGQPSAVLARQDSAALSGGTSVSRRPPKSDSRNGRYISERSASARLR